MSPRRKERGVHDERNVEGGTLGITEQEVFKQLIDRFKQLQGSDTLTYMFISDVIREIKKIEKQYNDGWISIEEGLPDDTEDYIAALGDGTVVAATLTDIYSMWYEEKDLIACPEPPRRVRTENRKQAIDKGFAALKELRQYRAIGTVEECLEAVE